MRSYNAIRYVRLYRDDRDDMIGHFILYWFISYFLQYFSTRVVVFVCACGVCDIYEMMRDVMRYVVIHFVIIKRR